MKKLLLVLEGIFAFIISYLSLFAALAVLPSTLGVMINLYYGNLQNAGTMFSFVVCAVVLSSSMIVKHLKKLGIIAVQ